MSKSLLLASLQGAPIAMLPEKAEAIAQVLARGSDVHFIDRAPQAGTVEMDAAAIIRDPKLAFYRYRRRDNLALIRAEGTLMHREPGMNPESGYTGYANIIANVQAAEADPEIDALVFDICSPGGQTWGLEECAEVISSASKPTFAAVDYLCCSAAYWLASQCGMIIAPAQSMIGSIGAYTLHVDYSRKLEQDGVKVTFIHAGAKKVAGNQFEPLPEDVRAELQSGVDASFDAFVTAVAKGRPNLSDSFLRGLEANVYNADQALELGLIDEVSPLEVALDMISQLVS